MTGAIEVVEVRPDEQRFGAVMALAVSVLGQDRYLVRDYNHALESHIVAAFADSSCVGFLRFLIQVIGSEQGRAPIVSHGVPLTEGFVDAFGVDPSHRRHGIGSKMQNDAIEYARSAGCYQMRSRSPVTSVENYSLKIRAGYVLNPSEQNDSYYFLLKL